MQQRILLLNPIQYENTTNYRSVSMVWGKEKQAFRPSIHLKGIWGEVEETADLILAHAN